MDTSTASANTSTNTSQATATQAQTATTQQAAQTTQASPAVLISPEGKFTPDFAKAHPGLAKFSEPSALYKSYESLQSMLGSQNKVPVLNPTSTPEEIALYREKMGVPTDAKGYELKLPAKLDNKDVPTDLMPQASLDKWAERFHKANIPKAVAAELVSEYLRESLTAVDGINNGMAEARQQAETALKTDWGQNYTKNLALAERAAAAVGLTKEMVANDPALANNPNFIRAMVKVGAMMGEDSAAGARGTQPSIANPDVRLAEIRSQMMTKGYNKNSPVHASLMQEMQTLIGQKEKGAGRG